MTKAEMDASCPNREVKLKSREKGSCDASPRNAGCQLPDNLVVITLSQYIALRYGTFKFGGRAIEVSLVSSPMPCLTEDGN